MKTQSIITLLLMSIIFCTLLSCSTGTTTTQQNTPGVSCTDCRETETYGHTMEEFLEVTREYRDKRWKLINTQLPNMTDKHDTADARAIWFSLDSLKNFICTIEKYATQLHLKPEDLGVRMYYAVYKHDESYQGLHTLFMVPTFGQPGNKDQEQDFDPRASVLYRDQLKSRDSIITFVDLANYPNQRTLILSKGAENTSLVRNNGDLCPPKCSAHTNTIDIIDSQ
jgi:hypothetical protein